MGQVVTIGLDIAKSVFQVHEVDAAGEVILRRQIRRAQLLAFFAKQPACLVGIEACASAHHWARELSALGHQVRLMPASYVKPYVKRQKNDAADAEAICEAVTRPTMRFVDVKSPEQQSVMVLHRVLLMLMRQRIQLSNAIRGHMAEFGLVAPIGREGLQGVGRAKPTSRGGIATPALASPNASLSSGQAGCAIGCAIANRPQTWIENSQSNQQRRVSDGIPSRATLGNHPHPRGRAALSDNSYGRRLTIRKGSPSAAARAEKENILPTGTKCVQLSPHRGDALTASAAESWDKGLS